MSMRTWIEQAASLEAPSVSAVNFQVRTGISAPFEPHMAEEAKPSVAPVNFQVRTGISAPFEPHMTGDKEETATHTAVTVPAPTFMIDA